MKGGCLCGAVRYEAKGEPVMAGHCCCGACQKLGGSGHNSFAVFPADTVTVTGTTKSHHYTADSGGDVETSFCPACGSPLFSRPSRFAGMVGIRLASLDEPAAVTPGMAFYTDSKQPWDALPAGLQTFPGMMPSG